MSPNVFEQLGHMDIDEENFFSGCGGHDAAHNFLYLSEAGNTTYNHQIQPKNSHTILNLNRA